MNNRRLKIGCLLLTLFAAACTQDEVTDSNALPEGAYPITLTAVQVGEGEAHSRVSDTDRGSTHTSQWTAGDQIKVKVSGGSKTQETTCTLDAGGNITAYNPPLYWQSKDNHTITAWYSNLSGQNTTSSTVSLADQSGGLAYVMKANAMTANYQSGNITLNFKHQLAKVRVKIEGERASSVTKVSVKGYTNCTVTEGTVAGTGSGYIPMRKNGDYYEAALVPMSSIAADDFIKLNDDTYASVSGITQLGAGKVYDCTLTINKKQIYNGMQWEATDVKTGDYVYTDGTISDGGLRAVHTDGTTLSETVNPTTGKTCCGIIFHIRNNDSPTDNCYYESFTGVPTGYIVSLDENTSQWWTTGVRDDGNNIGGNTDINGYTLTHTYLGWWPSGNDKTELVAIPWCTSRTQITSTSQSAFSTWYMPSFQEYVQMRGITINGKTPLLDYLRANILKASGTDLGDKQYASSALMGSMGLFLYMYNVLSDKLPPDWSNKAKDSHSYRAVCAFQLK